MGESVGKISLDLEVKSDLLNEINSVSSSIGDRLRRTLNKSVKKVFGNTGRSTDTVMKSVENTIEGTMKKATGNVNKTTQSMMKNTTDMIRKTFSDAGKVAGDTINNIGQKSRNLTRSILNAFKLKTPSTAPVSAEPVAQKASTKIPVAATPRAPPTLNIDRVSSEMETVKRTMDNLESKIRSHKQKLKDLRESYNRAFNPDVKDTIHNKILNEESAINSLINKMDTLGAKYEKLERQASEFSQAQNVAANATKAATSKMSGMSSVLGRFNSSGKKSPSLLSRIGQGFNNIGRHSKKASVNVNSFGGGIGNSLGQMMKWMIILPGIASGIKALTTSLISSLNTNEQFVSSLNLIKSNLLVAFTPIYNAILPAINALMSALATATSYVASFISMLFGKTFQQSFENTKSLIAAKDAMGAYGNAAKKAGGDATAAGKAAKAAQRDILGFDKIEKLSDNSDSDGSGSADDSNAPVLIQPPNMDALDAATLPWVKKFKDIMSKIFEPFKQAWDREGKATISSMKYALSSVWDLVKSIGRSFLKVWTNGTGELMLTNLFVIFQNIFKIIGNIATGLQAAWEKNNTGTKIIQSIFNLFNIILGTIRDISGATVEWSAKLNFTPLLTSIHGLLQALEPLTANIGAGLEWFWDNVLLPIAGWTIQTAVPTFLDMLAAAIGAVNAIIDALKPLGTWLFDNFLKPLAEFTGGLFISVMKTITDLLKKFSDWCQTHQTTIQNIAIVVGSFFAAWKIGEFVTKAVGLVSTIINIVGSIKSVAGALSLVTTALGGPVTIAIAAAIAIGILLWKNWDKISAKAKEVWDFVKKKFNEFREFLSGIFTRDWTKDFGIIGKVFNAFFKSISDIWNSIKLVFKGVIDFVQGVFTGNWRQAWEGIKNIFKGVFDSLGKIVKSPINGIIAILNGLISGVATAVNAVAKMLNKLKVTIPSWVPGIGGKSIGFNLPTWSPGKIPYLAKGGVIDHPTLAMMGEDGKEAVVPLERNREWIKRVSDEMRNQQNTGNEGMSAEVIQLLEKIILLLQTLDIVKIDEESLRKYFIKTTNKNTQATGKCELLT